jgi:hypothetical protein
MRSRWFAGTLSTASRWIYPTSGGPPPQTLFTAQTPTGDNLSDATDYTFGLAFTADVAGTVVGVRWWAPSGGVGGQPVTGLLYSHDSEAAGTVLASKVFGPVVAGGWNSVLFDSPVPIVAATPYVAARLCLDPHYVATGGFFHDSPYTNGHLTGYLDAVDHKNGRFIGGAGAPAYPASSFNGGNYFVDVLFLPSP